MHDCTCVCFALRNGYSCNVLQRVARLAQARRRADEAIVVLQLWNTSLHVVWAQQDLHRVGSVRPTKCLRRASARSLRAWAWPRIEVRLTLAANQNHCHDNRSHRTQIPQGCDFDVFYRCRGTRCVISSPFTVARSGDFDLSSLRSRAFGW